MSILGKFVTACVLAALCAFFIGMQVGVNSIECPECPTIASSYPNIEADLFIAEDGRVMQFICDWVEIGKILDDE